MHYETNSKLVKNGDVFVAIKGQHFDGHDYIDEALKNGAFMVIGERKIKTKEFTYKKVASCEKFLIKKIGKENHKLSRNLKIIGITGTKGKSTTAIITYQMLKAFNVKVAYLGTLGLYYNNKEIKYSNTTPDILTINKILKLLIQEDITHLVMEVSSHALSLKRINGLNFYISAFTNLSQDHLDFHHTIDNYLKAKLKILKYTKGTIILNNDDNYAKSFIKKTRNYFLIGENSDFQIDNYVLNQTNTIVNFEYLYNKYTVAIPFVGKFNIYNYLMALSIVMHLGYEIEDIINITTKIKPIKGRCELIKSAKGFIVIDYAHSPGSVENILKTYNELKKGKIFTIIGCGGNRDKTKRPIMASLAIKYSDYVIFTSDNPRDEDPNQIIKDMTKDLKSDNYEVIINRSKAIKKGIKLLKKNDYLLVLGKGHEDYQIIKNKKLPFDDKKEVLKYL